MIKPTQLTRNTIAHLVFQGRRSSRINHNPIWFPIILSFCRSFPRSWDPSDKILRMLRFKTWSTKLTSTDQGPSNSRNSVWVCLSVKKISNVVTKFRKNVRTYIISIIKRPFQILNKFYIFEDANALQPFVLGTFFFIIGLN